MATYTGTWPHEQKRSLDAMTRTPFLISFSTQDSLPLEQASCISQQEVAGTRIFGLQTNGPSEAPKRLPRSPQSTLGPRLEKTRQEGTRQEETTEDEDKRSQDKRRPKRQKPAQDKTRQDKTRGRTTRGDQRGEVYAPKRRCFPTRFHKRTKGLSDPRRPRPLEPSTTDFSCI